MSMIQPSVAEFRFRRILQEIEHSKRLHSVSFWTGLVGGVVLLLNQDFGAHLNSPELVALAGIVATMVIGGHYSASKIAEAVGYIASSIVNNEGDSAKASSSNPVPASGEQS